jgi:chromosome segregation ATPase
MEREDRRTVASILEANTERVPVEELAARGRSHVRVISGQKTLELIEAVVNRTIARRAGEMAGEIADRDRRRIVEEANEQFQRVSRMQSEAEQLIEQQRGLIARKEGEIAELRRRLKAAAGSLKRRERRLENARTTIMSYDAEIERLAAQVRMDADVIGDLKTALKAASEAGRPAADLGALRDELVALLSERQAASSAQIEARFQSSMDQTLDKISRTLNAATARPIDSRIEATEALVARLFDRESEMESNLGALDVSVTTAEDGIAKSLERLRRLRGDFDEDVEDEGVEDEDRARA